MTPPESAGVERSVVIPAGDRRLPGSLSVPIRAQGVVVFAHESGSGRFSPRNRQVAAVLTEAGFATLLLDLLDESEAQDRARVFDIDLLAGRLDAAAGWLEDEPGLRELPLGYFGASTGAAAALVAAAQRPDRVAAVVSRGGRPDLAGESLGKVNAPTLLIVGGLDVEVLALNRQALARLAGPRQLTVIPGATYLFPEPGALDEVSRLATLWFGQHLRGPRTP